MTFDDKKADENLPRRVGAQRALAIRERRPKATLPLDPLLELRLARRELRRGRRRLLLGVAPERRFPRRERRRLGFRPCCIELDYLTG